MKEVKVMQNMEEIYKQYFETVNKYFLTVDEGLAWLKENGF